MKKINWQFILNIALCGFFLDFTLHEVHRRFFDGVRTIQKFYYLHLGERH